mgnify:FL=1
MTNDKTIEQLMAEIDERVAWFQGDDFILDEAKERFLEVKQLAERIEKALTEMKNEIEMLEKDLE